jgi:hypothetical protein
MNIKEKLPVEDKDQLFIRVDELHDQLRQSDPVTLAAQTGASYLPTGSGQGTFYLPFWDAEVCLTYPEFVGRNGRTGELLMTFDQALLAYYFTLSDGSPQRGQWISFSELPDGRFYSQAYQGYTGNELAKVFGNDDGGFVKTAEALRGRRPDMAEPLGDMAFRFAVLPHVSLLAVCWLGDEDFPASYRILFDVVVSHHLSTDTCAIVGSTLTRRLIKSYGQIRSG